MSHLDSIGTTHRSHYSTAETVRLVKYADTTLADEEATYDELVNAIDTLAECGCI